MRDYAEEPNHLIPTWLPDMVLDAVRLLPGYALVSAAVGHDLISGRKTEDLGATLEKLLAVGNFAPGVAELLKAMHILEYISEMVRVALAKYGITIARISRDIVDVVDRLRLTDGIDANVAIMGQPINNLANDIRSAITDLTSQLIQAVREAAISLVDPLLTKPEVEPVWTLAIKVMGYDPLHNREVTSPTVDILAGFLRILGRTDVLEQMMERGTLQHTADWIDTQLSTFRGLANEAIALFNSAWDAISPENLPNVLDSLSGLADRAINLFGKVTSFATTVIGKVLEIIKDSLLGLLSQHAHELPGFKLLTVILGRNPISGQDVERNATNLIGGFIELLPDGDQILSQLSESGVIAGAAARIEGEMSRLGISWEMITSTFRAIWDQFTLTDLLDPIGAIGRTIALFGEPLGRIISFVATVLEVVIELVLRLMNFPMDLLGDIISGVQQALADIKRDPIGFLNNLVATLKQGFQQFFDNILGHLVHGLAAWLFRGLKSLGIELPTDYSGGSVLKLVLDTLGLSMDFLWERLAVAVGPDRAAQIRAAVDAAGQAWEFIKDVQERGMIAIWDYVKDQLGKLWDTIINTAKDWLMQNLIEAAIQKVLSMLDPTGVMAVVNSFLAFFRAVQSVIEYITEILQIIKDYVDTLAAIASGNLQPGADKLEKGLANAVPVAIGFLATQVGLGNVPEKIVEIIEKLREMVTKAIDWLIGKLASLTGLSRAGDKGDDEVEVPTSKTTLFMTGESHSLWVAENGGALAVFMASSAAAGMVAKIEKALGSNRLGVKPREKLKKLKKEIVDHEKKMKKRWDTPLPSGKKRRRLPKSDLVALQEYRATLMNFAAEHGVTDLIDFGHASKYVTDGNVIAKEYRTHPTWRETFYGGWKGGNKKAVTDAAFNKGRAEWEAASGRPLPPNQRVFRCAWCGKLYSTIAAMRKEPSVEFRKLTIDHTTPVVKHFATKGKGMTQQGRQDWYNRKSNLKPMCKACNTEDTRLDKWDWKVKDTFRGPGDPP